MKKEKKARASKRDGKLMNITVSPMSSRKTFTPINEKKELKKRVMDRLSKFKSKTIFGEKIYFHPNLIKEGSSFRVSHLTGCIEVDPKIFNKHPKEFQYFLVRWAKYCWKHHEGDNSYLVLSDTLATNDYLKKEYSAKLLRRCFNKLVSGQANNVGRILSMNMNLNRIKK